MQAIRSTCRLLPLFDVAASRCVEARALASADPHVLMRRAGLAVARLAMAVAPHARHVWVATGPGNNGGDGLEAAIHLKAWGREVRVSLTGDAAALPADARDAFDRAVAAGVTIDAQGDTPPSLEPNDVAIDALLGIGASRAPQGSIAEAIAAINALPCAVIAVDLPSGLNADTGQPLGEACVVATHTLALLTLKPGLFTGSGRDQAGVAWIDALGAQDAVAASLPSAWLSGSADEPSAAADHRPRHTVPPDVVPAPDRLGSSGASHAPRGVHSLAVPRLHAQHKGSFGDVAVVAGAPGMTGAAWLAGRAAHAAGAGRVYVDLLDEASVGAGDPVRPELMFQRGWWQAEAKVLATATVVCGCGGGEAIRTPLPRLLELVPRLVLDADALNAIACDASLQAALRTRLAGGLATILTPHPLEAARLLGCATAQVQSDRLSSARKLVEHFRCVVVLKGSGTVIAAPGMPPRINATGNASLASAGTGDVLAGWLGGLWAQAAPGDVISVAFESASLATAQHGAAAEPQRPGSMRAGDLIEALHQRLRGTLR
ncbi:bifunctional ADP-dependent NAD(P)H-hydrate dehydratase/NAD(P)H-hydrate epimerase [soil metagenome]